MTALKRFYNFVASQPCVRCQRQPVEVAHLRLFPSKKATDFMPRRQGIAAYSALPVCADCHRHAPDSVHAIGEAAWMDSLGKPPGWVYGLCARMIAEALS